MISGKELWNNYVRDCWFVQPPKPAEPSDVFSAIRQVDKQRQEPEKIRLWRIEQQERLKKKGT